MEFSQIFETLFTVTFFAAILRAATPMIFATLGGLISELAGVINVALEGMMLIAAFVGVIASAYAPLLFPEVSPIYYALFGAFCGLLSSVIIALVLAVFYLEFSANLIIAGVGINILASGLTVFLLFTLTGDKGASTSIVSYVLPSIKLTFLSGVPIIGDLLGGTNGEGHHILIYIAFLSIGVVWIFLHKTKMGLQLRAVGENIEACRSAGIPVKKIQYKAILISGLLSGFGGIYLSMGYLSLFQADMTAGRGFLALAAVFLGARSVLGTAAAAIFFGLSSVFAANLGLFNVPTTVIYSIAPIVTIVALLALSFQRNKRNQLRIKNAYKEICTNSEEKIT